jgi:hypothetical protein
MLDVEVPLRAMRWVSKPSLIYREDSKFGMRISGPEEARGPGIKSVGSMKKAIRR